MDSDTSQMMDKKLVLAIGVDAVRRCLSSGRMSVDVVVVKGDWRSYRRTYRTGGAVVSERGRMTVTVFELHETGEMARLRLYDQVSLTYVDVKVGECVQFDLRARATVHPVGWLDDQLATRRKSPSLRQMVNAAAREASVGVEWF